MIKKNVGRLVVLNVGELGQANSGQNLPKRQEHFVRKFFWKQPLEPWFELYNSLFFLFHVAKHENTPFWLQHTDLLPWK